MIYYFCYLWLEPLSSFFLVLQMENLIKTSIKYIFIISIQPNMQPQTLRLHQRESDSHLMALCDDTD